MNYKAKSKNAKGSVFSKSMRFPENNLLDKGTGSSAYLGPGSYNPMDCFNRLVGTPCSTLIVSQFLSFVNYFCRNLLKPYQNTRVGSNIISWWETPSNMNLLSFKINILKKVF